MLEDQRLIWQLKTGREEGLVRIYEKYKRYLLKIASGLLVDVTLAEDVVQDVFLSLAESSARLQVYGNLRGYLVRSLINRVQNVYRQQRNREKVRQEEVSPARSEALCPGQWVILNEKMQCACAALAELPEEQRAVVVYHVYAELKFREIANLEKVSINTIHSRYRYGLEKLRSVLQV